MSEKINTDHFSTMEDLLEHLKMWEGDDDMDSYYRFFSPSCAFELANRIERQQKEIEKLNKKKYIFNAETGEVKEIPIDNNYISKDKIMAKIEELEQKAKEMKYDYDVSYAEEDLFNKNVKFFKEQMQKLLGE